MHVRHMPPWLSPTIQPHPTASQPHLTVTAHPPPARPQVKVDLTHECIALHGEGGARTVPEPAKKGVAGVLSRHKAGFYSFVVADFLQQVRGSSHCTTTH
jgi:hypothetical protein